MAQGGGRENPARAGVGAACGAGGEPWAHNTPAPPGPGELPALGIRGRSSLLLCWRNATRLISP